MKTQTEIAMDGKEREALQQAVRDAVNRLLERTCSVSFMIPNKPKVGRDEATFIMAGPAVELQQYSARHLR